jgi:hypothetical protein
MNIPYIPFSFFTLILKIIRAATLVLMGYCFAVDNNYALWSSVATFIICGICINSQTYTIEVVKFYDDEEEGDKK